MSISPEKIICEKDQKYDCTDCDGICCKNFSIKVDYKTKVHLESLEYIKNLIYETGCDFEEAPDGRFYIPTIQQDKHYKCLFYDSSEKCLIHNRNSFEEKPVTCQTFPISTYLDSENNFHIETSFRCKSILENYGNNLEDIKESLVTSYLNLEYYPEKFQLESKVIQQLEVFNLANKLKSILNDPTIPIENSVFKYFQYVKEFKNRYITESNISKVIDISDNYNSFIAKHDSNQIFAKLIIGIYLSNLLIYSTYTRKNLLFKDVNKIIREYSKLYFSIIHMKESIHLPASGKTINLKDLSKVDFILDNRSEDLIRRYLKASITRYKYMTMESTNLQFLNRVIIYFSLIKIMSKIMSLEENQLTTDFSSISKAISLIEQVFYHTKFSLSPIKATENALNSILYKFINQENTIHYLIKYGLK